MRYVCVIFLTAVLFLGGCSMERPSMTIVCIGDSLTVCGGNGGLYTDWLAVSLPRHSVINKGIGGDTLAGGRLRFQQDVLALKPDVVLIELGANDYWRMNRPIEALKDDLEDMVKRAKAAKAEVVIASCFGDRDYKKEKNVKDDPLRNDFGDAIAKMENEICQRYGCFYVPDMQVDIRPGGRAPYWSDGTHPNKEGNRLVAKRILPELKKAIAVAAKKKK